MHNIMHQTVIRDPVLLHMNGRYEMSTMKRSMCTDACTVMH